jgi:hypothetical protein
MNQIHYIPSAFGDMKLERVDDKKTKLVTGKLSPLEEKACRELLVKYSVKDDPNPWTPSVKEFEDKTFDLSCKIEKARDFVVKHLRPTGKLLTAFKLSAEAEVQEAPDGKVPEAAKVAVTTEVPKRGCPMSLIEEREVKATEVLRIFLSPTQLADFEEQGACGVVGGDTGTHYMVAHRYSRVAIREHGLVKNLDTGVPVCSELTLLPPAEEMLALVLALQFREEEWLRGAN